MGGVGVGGWGGGGGWGGVGGVGVGGWGGQKCKFPHLAKYQNGGGVLNLRQEKCDKSLNLLPILIYKVFFMELHTQ